MAVPASTQPPATVSALPPVPVQTQRSILIDVVRGLAITLVVLGHTNQGVIHRGWWGSSSVGDRLNDAIYSFHMPAFFFVSGIFLIPGVAKRGERLYTLEKVRTMIWPYVLWTFLFAGATIAFGRFMVQTTPTPRQFVYNLLTGEASWFLPTIFFAVVLGMLGRRLPLVLFFVLAAAASLYAPATHVNFVDRGIHHLVFLVAGMGIGSSYSSFERTPKVLAALLAILLGAAIVVATHGSFAGQRFFFIPLGFLGTLMLLMVARLLDHSAIARLFSWTGAASFGIFLLSSFPQGAGRELVRHLLRTTSPVPHLIVATLMATLIPAWLYHRRVRLRLQWMFIWPF